jgi:high potential iron-sulfur protein
MRQKLSRRHFLRSSAMAAGAAAGLAAAARAEAQTKASHETVKYQDSPKGSQRCDNCSYFEPPNACKLVQSPISPNGWCMLWAKKA